jgi:hypothetical protein
MLLIYAFFRVDSLPSDEEFMHEIPLKATTMMKIVSEV